eukprot:131173-Heterocapsa_arctica.AAC.1
MDARRHMDIKHGQQAKDLRAAFALDPDQDSDEKLDRNLAFLRKQKKEDVQASDEEADRKLALLRKQTEEEAA